MANADPTKDFDCYCSCCGEAEKPVCNVSPKTVIAFFFSFIILVISFVYIFIDRGSINVFLPVITGIFGIWIPSPIPAPTARKDAIREQQLHQYNLQLSDNMRTMMMGQNYTYSKQIAMSQDPSRTPALAAPNNLWLSSSLTSKGKTPEGSSSKEVKGIRKESDLGGFDAINVSGSSSKEAKAVRMDTDVDGPNASNSKVSGDDLTRKSTPKAANTVGSKFSAVLKKFQGKKSEVSSSKAVGVRKDADASGLDTLKGSGDYPSRTVAPIGATAIVLPVTAVSYNLHKSLSSSSSNGMGVEGSLSKEAVGVGKDTHADAFDALTFSGDPETTRAVQAYQRFREVQKNIGIEISRCEAEHAETENRLEKLRADDLAAREEFEKNLGAFGSSSPSLAELDAIMGTKGSRTAIVEGGFAETTSLADINT